MVLAEPAPASQPAPRFRTARAAFRRALPYGVPVFAAVWLTHVVLTLLGDPLGVELDFGLWVVACLLHLFAFASLLAILVRVHERACGSRRRAIVLFSVWSATALTLLLV